MSIAQNTALFSLLGTFYGGDGKSTFALPNLQGRAPTQQGTDSFGDEYFLGQEAGVDAVTLLQSEMPSHTHFAQTAEDPATVQAPAPDRSMAPSTPGFAYTKLTNQTPLVQMNFQELSIIGSGFPHNNMQPYLTLNYIIALQGVFPARQ
jgi:microcystin-dependent protein